MINLKKGDAPVSLTKGSGIVLNCSWDSDTDYDLVALVLYKDGHVETVATFGAETKPRVTPNAVFPQEKTPDGAVIHGGDAVNGQGDSGETINVTLNDNIRAIVPVCYSAQSNGVGSFKQYMVSMTVSDGAGQTAKVEAIHASNDSNIYTCVPGWVENTDSGVLVHYLEAYSERNSENRPIVRFKQVKKGMFSRAEPTDQVEIVMDKGPRNDDKRF
ncbi:TerD family protein [Rhodococcus qingshengii]|uniref:TerD family protein n=1 Tax=Rhodococcus qingshengii TaxID=334542 RepID=UPI0035DAEA5C